MTPCADGPVGARLSRPAISRSMSVGVAGAMSIAQSGTPAARALDLEFSHHALCKLFHAEAEVPGASFDQLASFLSGHHTTPLLLPRMSPSPGLPSPCWRVFAAWWIVVTV